MNLSQLNSRMTRSNTAFQQQGKRKMKDHEDIDKFLDFEDRTPVQYSLLRSNRVHKEQRESSRKKNPINHLLDQSNTSRTNRLNLSNNLFSNFSINLLNFGKSQNQQLIHKNFINPLDLKCGNKPMFDQIDTSYENDSEPFQPPKPLKKSIKKERKPTYKKKNTQKQKQVKKLTTLQSSNAIPECLQSPQFSKVIDHNSTVKKPINQISNFATQIRPEQPKPTYQSIGTLSPQQDIIKKMEIFKTEARDQIQLHIERKQTELDLETSFSSKSLESPMPIEELRNLPNNSDKIDIFKQFQNTELTQKTLLISDNKVFEESSARKIAELSRKFDRIQQEADKLREERKKQNPSMQIDEKTGEKMYKCPFCPKTFQKNCQLGGHVSKSHKDQYAHNKSHAPKNKAKQDREARNAHFGIVKKQKKETVKPKNALESEESKTQNVNNSTLVENTQVSEAQSSENLKASSENLSRLTIK